MTKSIPLSNYRMRLGTRGSSLALIQAKTVSDLLKNAIPGLEIEVITVKTSGDLGNREVLGAFVKEIQEALLDQRIDLALHCLKDLPTQSTSGLTLAAMLPREDPREAWIGRAKSLMEIPSGSTVGTGSLRRTSQMRSFRPDLEYRPLVGNVDTRLRKLLAGEYDAIVLAMAGLSRLGLLEGWGESAYSSMNVSPIETSVIVPAAGQAVLALEARESDENSIEVAQVLECSGTRACATAERSFLGHFGTGCSLPIGAFAQIENDEIMLEGLVCSSDGQTKWKQSINGSAGEARNLGLELAKMAPRMEW